VGLRLSGLGRHHSPFYDYIFGEGLEALSVGLDDGNGNITGFASFDISYDAGFAFVCAADDFALGTVA
jgi:hypothetical protein